MHDGFKILAKANCFKCNAIIFNVKHSDLLHIHEPLWKGSDVTVFNTGCILYYNIT